MMREHETDNSMVDDLFAAARADSTEASPAFMARVLADADRVQAGFAAPERAARQCFNLRAVFSGLGGWPALGGLVTSTMVGVWLGLTPLTDMSDTVAGYMYGSTDYEELATDYAWLDTLGGI